MVIGIDYRLVIHRRVDGGDNPPFDTEAVIEYFDNRYHTVGGTGGGGDDGLTAIEKLMVNPVDNGGIHIGLGGLGKQHALCTTLNMLLGGGAVTKGATAFQHHIYIQLSPGQLVYMFAVKNSNGVAINTQLVVADFNDTGETPVSGIVAGQVADGFTIGQLINCHYLNGAACI